MAETTDPDETVGCIGCDLTLPAAAVPEWACGHPKSFTCRRCREVDGVLVSCCQECGCETQLPKGWTRGD